MSTVLRCFGAVAKRVKHSSRSTSSKQHHINENSFASSGIRKRSSYSQCYSTITTNPHSVENVQIEHGSKGPITLTIFHPLSGSWFESVILYLPAGPILEQASRPAFDDAIISALSASSNSTIIRVNYRTGQYAPFPLPVHDVLAGYDWILKFLQDEDKSNSQAVQRRIGVCGQLFGGGLASSLALTEFRATQAQIVAAAVNNPIIDWVVSDRFKLEMTSDSDTVVEEESGDRNSEIVIGLTQSRKRSKVKTPAISSWQRFEDSEVLSPETIIKARNWIFTNENGYFDNFASPIHWFRTPGIELNQDVDKMTSFEDDAHPTPQLLRKYRLNFPPSGSELLMPHIRVTSGEESILATQNEEFSTRIQTAEVTNYLRARHIKHAKYKQLTQDDRSEVDFICDLADQKYPSKTLPGVGLWGLGKENIWRPDVEDAGRWLRNLMLPP